VPLKYYEYTGGTHTAPLQGGAGKMLEFFDKYSKAEAQAAP